MIVVAWLLAMSGGLSPHAFVDFAECKALEAKYPGSECVRKKIFVQAPTVEVPKK